MVKTKTEDKKEGFLERLGERLDNASAWHKRFLAVVAIVATVSGTVATISNNFNNALDERIGAQTQNISSQLQEQTDEIQNIRLDTLRVQLLQYIYNEPEAHETILRLAYTYFVTYKGDWVMTDKFRDWADSQGVNIPFELSH